MKNVDVASELNKIKPEILKNVEADSYWCFAKIMNEILDNYANAWPGI